MVVNTIVTISLKPDTITKNQWVIVLKHIQFDAALSLMFEDFDDSSSADLDAPEATDDAELVFLFASHDLENVKLESE